jgi:hypothetical protein
MEDTQEKWPAFSKETLTIKSNLLSKISLNKRGKKYVVIIWTMLQAAQEISIQMTAPKDSLSKLLQTHEL